MRKFLDRVRRWATRDIVAAIDRGTRAQVKELRSLRRALLQEARQQSVELAFLALDDDEIVRFNYLGHDIQFYLPDGRTDAVQGRILRHRSFYEEPILRTIRDEVGLKGAHVVDAGANVGNHTVYFAEVCGAADCLSFEPNPYTRAILRRNVELNNLGNVTIHAEALSNAPGLLSFDRYQPHNLGGTSLVPGEDDGIAAIRLDDLALAALDFLKLDVELSTERALNGARATLAQHRPVILVEMLPAELDACSAILDSLGYRRALAFADHNFLYRHAG